MENKANDLDRLLKTIDNTAPKRKQNQRLSFSRKKLRSICRSLSYDVDKYKPEWTSNLVKGYLNSDQHLPRILYSEITSYVYSMNAEDRGGFATNVEALLEYAFDENNHVDQEVQETIMRIYDHCQLAIYQADNIHNSFVTGIEDTKNSLTEQFKGIEKE